MKNVVTVLVVAYIVLFALFWQLPDNRFHIWFLNVGQGDSIFIKTPQNHQILVDGGPKNKVMEELAAVMPFFDKSIDLVVLTHPHADHIEGLIEVLNRYEVENVLFTGASYENSTYEEFLRLIRQKSIPFFIADKDLDFKLGEVFVDVLYPLHQVAAQSFSNINNSSIAMRISYKDKAVVLTGDMEVEAEKELLKSGITNLRANIFKAGHHGSKTASSSALLNAIQPEDVVIQVGKDNSFNHPHIEALQNFYLIEANIWRNDLDGRVEFAF